MCLYLPYRSFLFLFLRFCQNFSRATNPLALHWFLPANVFDVIWKWPKIKHFPVFGVVNIDEAQRRLRELVLQFLNLFCTRLVISFDWSASPVWCLAGVPPRAAASLKSGSCTDRRHHFPLIMRRNTIKAAEKRRRRRRNETRTTCIIHLPTSPRWTNTQLWLQVQQLIDCHLLFFPPAVTHCRRVSNDKNALVRRRRPPKED